MNQLQINSISAINGYILLVFYTNGKCWQFRVISPDASVYGSQQIFYTSEAALLGWHQLGWWWRKIVGMA